MSSKKIAPLKLELARMKTSLDTLINASSPDIDHIGRLEAAISAYKELLREYQVQVREVLTEVEDDVSEGVEAKKPNG